MTRPDTTITTYNFDCPRWLWREFGAALEDNETYNDPLLRFVARETLERRDGDLDADLRARIEAFAGVEADHDDQPDPAADAPADGTGNGQADRRFGPDV